MLLPLHATVMASGSLTSVGGRGITSYDSYQVSYLEHHMVLTEATGDTELVLWNG